ncbi:MAG: hypothetical protein L3J35_08450 [Bacteroidales bacterium]|nr:hypothetical protein [Bacteroidales bacterium]
MKKIGIYTLGFMFVLLFSQCGPTTEDAINYNDEIIAEQLDVIDKINDLDDAVTTYDSQQIKTALDAAKTQVEKSIKKLNEIGSFDGDSKFVDECTALFKIFESQINDEYKEQYEIYAERDAGNYTDEDQARSEELFKLIDDKYFPAHDKFTQAQDEFAAKWGFNLEAE